MGDVKSGVLPSPDSVMLRGFWYPALRSDQVHGKRMQKAMLLGEPLVLGRDTQERAWALRDNCPHRGIPLSYGNYDGDQVECKYHGWRFDARSGQCRVIPSLTERDKLKVDRIYAGHFPCEERDGYFWVYLPDPADRDQPPPPRLPLFGAKYRFIQLECDLPTSIDHGIIGLMDPAHGPFVHQSWWWRTRRSIYEKEKIFEPIPNGFRIRAHSPSANSAAYKLLGIYGQPITTTIEFVLPNMRFEQIHCGDYWFSSRATVTPITAHHCRIDFCAAWNVFRHVPFIVSILRVFAKMFLAQDQRTMIQQAEGLKYGPRLTLIDDADRPAKWYFQLKEAWLESKRTGLPLVHPIAAPVTLRWRS